MADSVPLCTSLSRYAFTFAYPDAIQMVLHGGSNSNAINFNDSYFFLFLIICYLVNTGSSLELRLLMPEWFVGQWLNKNNNKTTQKNNIRLKMVMNKDRTENVWKSSESKEV